MFTAFDPLSAKQSTNSEVAILALKREIQNILDSYVGWYDPFCELIQNALDSIEEHSAISTEDYEPTIRIIVDLKNNRLTVSDNGTGLDKEKFEQFLAPSFSFKSGKKTRGHKGVGATYLAYGFNDIQIATRHAEVSEVGRMKDARNWLSDPSPAGNPRVRHDSTGAIDKEFWDFTSGVSITLTFGANTKPGKLSWLQATKADQWSDILRIKTGLGAITENSKIHSIIRVISTDGTITECTRVGTSYLWPHSIVPRSKSLSEIQQKEHDLFNKHGADFKMPPAFSNLDAIYGHLNSDTLSSLIELDESEKNVCRDYTPLIYFCYMYSSKVWSTYNDDLNIRSGQSVLEAGIQIAANNMPQGEVVQIPLKRYTGRQNQMHLVLHLDNCRSDLGRKGFQKEIVDFGQSIARKLIEKPLQKYRGRLKPVTGTKSDIIRENRVDNWKTEFIQHEANHPLVISNQNFFLPTNRISLTSTPTREQDVIALFNQLMAGGVIRGIRVMSTNERFTYDGMFRITIEPPHSHHLYDKTTNPLGIHQDYIKENPSLLSSPKILEYKFSLDALIEDINSGVKNSNDINLIVVWETGSDFEGNYHITSLLDPDNLVERQYHGVSHVMTNISTNQREMDLIVLSELVNFLNNSEEEIENQRQKYDY